ncbi:MAG: hypothetical protein ACPGPS_17870, partial [Rubripirellula sp.]
MTAKAWNMGADFTVNAQKQRKNRNQSLRSAQSVSQRILVRKGAADRYPKQSSTKLTSYQPRNRSEAMQTNPRPTKSTALRVGEIGSLLDRHPSPNLWNGRARSIPLVRLSHEQGIASRTVDRPEKLSLVFRFLSRRLSLLC